MCLYIPEQDPRRDNSNPGAGTATSPRPLSHLFCSLEECQVGDRPASSFSRANFRGVFLPSLPWPFWVYFSDNFLVLQTSGFRCQRKCQRGRQADTHRPPPKGVGIWGSQLPNLLYEWPPQSAPAMSQTEEEEEAKGMWCTINAAIKGKRPCQLVTTLPAPCQKRRK
ncbi:hypothetical protein llap_16082 [Limosa lapponica baueri]|uniref:Uncharacterized protein n=1 Tax=Limosa lapponica baueri TaxID=1758121 RepID=A0A2I0TII4_LIMLA|nr:hypothetical protein llap_16082 [Limosa lapponica baueri]